MKRMISPKITNHKNLCEGVISVAYVVGLRKKNSTLGDDVDAKPKASVARKSSSSFIINH